MGGGAQGLGLCRGEGRRGGTLTLHGIASGGFWLVVGEGWVAAGWSWPGRAAGGTRGGPGLRARPAGWCRRGEPLAHVVWGCVPAIWNLAPARVLAWFRRLAGAGAAQAGQARAACSRCNGVRSCQVAGGGGSGLAGVSGRSGGVMVAGVVTLHGIVSRDLLLEPGGVGFADGALGGSGVGDGLAPGGLGGGLGSDGPVLGGSSGWCGGGFVGAGEVRVAEVWGRVPRRCMGLRPAG